MKSRVAYIGLGIVIGMGVQYLLTHRVSVQVTPVQSDANAKPEQALKAELGEKKPIRQFQIVAGSKVNPSSAQFVSEAEVERAAQKAADEPKEQTLGLTLEAQVLAELEANREVIRQHAFAEIMNDGWKIHVTADDPSLRKAGLRNGDLITTESINSQLQLPDRTELAQRLLAFLKSIER